MSELKPCPFCGGEAEFERMGDRRQSCIVVCTDCGGRHESGDEGERSGDSWNRRATPPIGTRYRDESGEVVAVVVPRYLPLSVFSRATEGFADADYHSELGRWLKMHEALPEPE